MNPHLDERLLSEWRELMEGGFEGLLKVFLSETAQQCRVMREQWSCGDRNGLGCLAHALKGSCSNMGATRCAGIASALEDAARGERWEAVSPLLGEFEQELAWTRAAFGDLSGPS